MTASTSTGADAADATRPELVEAVRAAVLPGFPELDPARTEVRVRWHRRRTRCSLAGVDLDDGTTSRGVVVKVRADEATERAGERHGRPRVAGGHVRAREAAELEHAGLVALERAAADRAVPGARAVRPLALLPDHAALVMAEAGGPTLKDVLQRGSRPRRSASTDLLPWRHAGSLLAAYQRQPAPPQARPWLSTPAEIGDLVGRLAGYLRSRGGADDLLLDVERRADGLLAEVRTPLLLAASHGDFAPRNLFAAADGSVALFDPMPAWTVPTAYDLATFSVALRTGGWQLASRGAAFARGGIEAREAALLAGHGTPSDDPVLHVLVLVGLLDRWSWLASPARDGGARGRLSGVKLAWLRSALVAEVRRSPALHR